MNDLPLVVGGAVRSPFDLATLTPESKNLGGDAGFSLGGGQAASYGTTLDGISANTSRALQKSWVASNAPSVEAITEFTVDTNGFKAEYGHAGGGVMTFVTKSGTNALHGSAYEFLRNNDFDANDWFSNRAGKARQIYKQNDFGFTVGGPVWIPKIYNGKDKTFFFFSYEGFRNRNGATNFATYGAHGRNVQRRFQQLGECGRRSRSRSSTRLRRPLPPNGTVTRESVPQATRFRPICSIPRPSRR